MPSEDPFASARWLEASESPFGARVLDCRVPARSVSALANDAQIVETFGQLRADRGDSLRRDLPADALAHDCDLRYAVDGGVPLGGIFRAESMEAKWDIFAFEDRFAFRRSWDGELAFVAYHAAADGAVRVERVFVAGRLASLGTLFAVGTVDALLRTHGLRQLVPFPLPPNAPPDARSAAVLVHAWHGTLGWFAAHGDTTGFRPCDPGEARGSNA